MPIESTSGGPSAARAYQQFKSVETPQQAPGQDPAAVSPLDKDTFIFNAGLIGITADRATELYARFNTDGQDGLTETEFDQLYASLGGEGLDEAAKSDEQFVTDLYRSELKRDPDPAGLQGMVGMLQQGVSRDQVRSMVENSAEYAALNPQAPAPRAGNPDLVQKAESYAGQKGGQCLEFVERMTGHYFQVENAKDMVNVHPGYDLADAPQSGDIFVSQRGQWGHTGIVKSVNPDGSITVVDSNSQGTGDSSDDELVRVHTYSAEEVAARHLVYLHRNPAEQPVPYGNTW